MDKDSCPDKAKHTPCPSGYIEWHAWAKKMGKTHVQHRCPTCNCLSIWKRKCVGNNA